MSQFLITGQTKLKGELPVNGAKNCALKIAAASLLSAEPMTISNFPEIEDTERLLEILRDLGCKCIRQKPHDYKIIPPQRIKKDLNHDLVRKLRASILLVGPMLARFGKVSMAHPGGCLIGKRPIDLFITSFKALGAKVTTTATCNIFTAPLGLTGCRIVFPKISVTATETLMLAATLAKGKTTLVNAACEPEIPALAEYLNRMGAKINGAGTPNIEIIGVKKIAGGHFENIPDRIEAGSFIILAAATKSHLKITHCNPEHLEIPLNILKDLGVKLKVGKDYIEVFPTAKLKAAQIATHEYPGFPTDIQAPMTVLLTQATGESIMRENIFEGRLIYTDILNRMGANIKLDNPQQISINGPTPLHAKEVESPDIRAGIAILIAALLAKGKTTINNIYQIDRGYERIEERLAAIGVQIKRV